MTNLSLSPQAFLHLLYNGARAIDVVESAHRLGLFRLIEAGPRSIADLSEHYGMVPGRLYKFMDCLETLGLVRRFAAATVAETAYQSPPGIEAAATAVLGPDSLERDREKFAWQELHGRLPEVLSGQCSMPREKFCWPLESAEQVAEFEASMAAGIGPIREAFHTHRARLAHGGQRMLDVGGGDGSLAVYLLADHEDLTVDVFNLPIAAPLPVGVKVTF